MDFLSNWPLMYLPELWFAELSHPAVCDLQPAWPEFKVKLVWPNLWMWKHVETVNFSRLEFFWFLPMLVVLLVWVENSQFHISSSICFVSLLPGLLDMLPVLHSKDISTIHDAYFDRGEKVELAFPVMKISDYLWSPPISLSISSCELIQSRMFDEICLLHIGSLCHVLSNMTIWSFIHIQQRARNEWTWMHMKHGHVETSREYKVARNWSTMCQRLRDSSPVTFSTPLPLTVSDLSPSAPVICRSPRGEPLDETELNENVKTTNKHMQKCWETCLELFGQIQWSLFLTSYLVLNG